MTYTDTISCRSAAIVPIECQSTAARSGKFSPAMQRSSFGGARSNFVAQLVKTHATICSSGAYAAWRALKVPFHDAPGL